MVSRNAINHVDLPFDVEEDHFTRQVRISAHGFIQAIPQDVWYQALAEKAIMHNLIENFYNNLRNYEKSRINRSVDYMMGAGTAVKCTPTKVPPPPAPKKENKLVLLCDD